MSTYGYACYFSSAHVSLRRYGQEVLFWVMRVIFKICDGKEAKYHGVVEEAEAGWADLGQERIKARHA
jgi:hypothetical protein